MMPFSHRFLGLTCVGLAFIYAGGQSFAADDADLTKLPAAATRTVEYERDILPIFQRTCYSCHGPEDQESGLRLDDKKRAFEGGDHGKAFEPGKSSESRLIHLVAGLDKETGLMPPEGEGTPLSAEQIGLLRAWIDQGAAWTDGLPSAKSPTDMWVLKPVLRPQLPHVHDTSWPLSPIDQFILARLDQEKLLPSPPADRATLLRRLYLDLLGLGPTADETIAFLADTRPDAYERLVDRLLASPHFGERWGRHWLDLARYADSDGYEKDRPRPFAWRYRNWVLNALNEDMPYDQFTIEQLAGDLIPGASIEQRVASGFHRNTLHNTEGGIDPEEDRVKKTLDRTNTTGAIWMGLTVGCAQCHSHKYDPLTQREYYQLYAFFNNIDEVDIDAPLMVERRVYEERKASFDIEHAPYLAAIKKYESEKLAAAQAEWEKTALAKGMVWTPLDSTRAESQHGATLEKQSDLSLLAKGVNQLSDVYVVEASPAVSTVSAVRIEMLPDDSLPKKGPGRSANGNFVLSTFSAELLADETAAPAKLQFVNARADFSQKECDVAHAVNDNSSDFWAVSPQFGKRHVAVFEVKQPATLAAGAKLRITLDQKYNRDAPHNLGRFRLSVTDSTSTVSLEGMPQDVAVALAMEASTRTEEQRNRVADYYRTVDPELVRLTKAADSHAKSGPKAPDTKSQSVAQRSELRGTNMFVRGDFLIPGDAVEPTVPAFLPPIQPRDIRADRLDLARWLVSADNPLAARVAVNRIWAQLFGKGLVRTVDDFGRQGEPPSHPELLDWLAAEFCESGWSTKHMLRTIVLSRAYQQSSAMRTELVGVDPENIWLARQNRRRVEAEVIRDLSLTASGLYDERIGGPSVRPPQPEEYSKLTYANSVSWPESKGGDRYRRGMYTFFQRTSPYPMLMTFDSPDSNECCAERESSNTPLQALTLWNDPAFFEIARAFGRRIVTDIAPRSDPRQTISDRVTHAVVVCLARTPSEAERNELIALYDSQLAEYQANPGLAVETNAKATPPANITPEELAAWTMVGRTILNLDEFITRE